MTKKKKLKKIGKLKPECLHHRKSLMLEFKWKKQGSNQSDLISGTNICNLLMLKTLFISKLEFQS